MPYANTGYDFYKRIEAKPKQSDSFIFKAEENGNKAFDNIVKDCNERQQRDCMIKGDFTAIVILCTYFHLKHLALKQYLQIVNRKRHTGMNVAKLSVRNTDRNTCRLKYFPGQYFDSAHAAVT